MFFIAFIITIFYKNIFFAVQQDVSSFMKKLNHS